MSTKKTFFGGCHMTKQEIEGFGKELYDVFSKASNGWQNRVNFIAHVEHVSRSGMFRTIKIAIIIDSKIIDISYSIGKYLQCYKNGFIGMRGWGMDMIFAAIYETLQKLQAQFSNDETLKNWIDKQTRESYTYF